MTKLPGTRVRGSRTGRPIMVLLDVLGQRWTLRLLWELSQGSATFRGLRTRCDNVSPTLLNKRLKELRELALIELHDHGYRLTAAGMSLAKELASLDGWANGWAAAIASGSESAGTGSNTIRSHNDLAADTAPDASVAACGQIQNLVFPPTAKGNAAGAGGVTRSG